MIGAKLAVALLADGRTAHLKCVTKNGLSGEVRTRTNHASVPVLLRQGRTSPREAR